MDHSEEEDVCVFQWHWGEEVVVLVAETAGVDEGSGFMSGREPSIVFGRSCTMNVGFGSVLAKTMLA